MFESKDNLTSFVFETFWNVNLRAVYNLRMMTREILIKIKIF